MWGSNLIGARCSVVVAREIPRGDLATAGLVDDGSHTATTTSNIAGVKVDDIMSRESFLMENFYHFH